MDIVLDCRFQILSYLAPEMETEIC